MALTYTTNTYSGRSVDVYELDTDTFIVKGFLDSRDEKIIEDAVAGTGVANTDMPNGQGTVLEYYSNLAKSAAELESAYFASQGITATLSDHQTTLDDHEARITTLEP